MASRGRNKSVGQHLGAIETSKPVIRFKNERKCRWWRLEFHCFHGETKQYPKPECEGDDQGRKRTDWAYVGECCHCPKVTVDWGLGF